MKPFPKWLIIAFIFEIALLFFAAAINAQSNDMPPHIKDIPVDGYSCAVRIQETQVIDNATGKVKREEIRYETHATVKYDGLHPDWKKMLSSRETGREAAIECVDWAEKVRKAIKGK